MISASAELIGCQVWQTAFDYQVRLTLTGRDPDEGYYPDAELVIETPFLLRDAHGEWHELDPGTGSALAPLLDLFMRTITVVDLGERGTLTLDFDDGAQLVVAAHPHFESWHLTGALVSGLMRGLLGAPWAHLAFSALAAVGIWYFMAHPNQSAARRVMVAAALVFGAGILHAWGNAGAALGALSVFLSWAASLFVLVVLIAWARRAERRATTQNGLL